MELEARVTLRCGCEERLSQWYDGRSARSRALAREWLDRQIEAHGAESCVRCQERRARELAGDVFEAHWIDAPPVIRAVCRVARLLEGSVRRSPKCWHSLYVTGPRIAWRVSDHPWPGRRESLISERSILDGRRWMARLRADWLEGEQ